MNKKYYFTYIATNKRNTVLYIGITNNILNRANQHQKKINKNSFTAKYNINKIVYYETFEDVYCALEREKQLKAGSRKKKIELINSLNLGWKDLTQEF